MATAFLTALWTRSVSDVLNLKLVLLHHFGRCLRKYVGMRVRGADMIVDGIQKYHGVDGFQRPLLPLFGDGQNLVHDTANRAVLNGGATDVLNVGFDVTGGHTLSIHGQDFLLDVLTDAGLVLIQHLSLKFTLSVMGDRHVHPPKNWCAASYCCTR